MRNDKAQQWFWNEASGEIHNAESPHYFLQNNKGELMVANVASSAAGVSAEFPRDTRKWFFDQTNHVITTEIGNNTNAIGTFGAPRPNQYLKVGVENMMREESKHRWRIEYCDTGKQEPDL